VALDDLKGIKIASSLGLRVTGTLGILVKAKRNGHISVLEPLVENLIQVGIRISPTIIKEIRKDYP
jgi:predicted nucleic acid-binding protein